jgi:site-specific recombinase XerD
LPVDAFSPLCSERTRNDHRHLLQLAAIRPHDVATYIEELQAAVQSPSVKQQLAAIRMLFNWLDRPSCAEQPRCCGARPQACRQDRQNPGARSRRLAQASKIDTDRDVARSARSGIDRDAHPLVCAHHRCPEDEGRGFAPRGAGWAVRLHEKGGKHHTMPCQHTLAEALHAYINAAGIAEDRKGWLFRTARGRNGKVLSANPMTQPDAWRMIRRRAAAGIAEAIGCHTFRATGTTAYLANGGALEHAQEMAAHESPRTTKLYDRTKERLTQDEVERIRL